MKRYLIIFILLSIQKILSQVQFEAIVNKTTLGLNERLRIDFVMNIDGDNFNEPSFEGFRVIAGPSQQVSQSWVNGKSSFEKIYSYYLIPEHKGNLFIKPATIEYNGQIYKTSLVRVNVQNAIEPPKDPNDNSITIDDNLYLVAEISKTTPYVNEPITVVYKLYFSYNIGIKNWRELGKPKYNDFWSQNIDIKQLYVQDGIFKGEKFRYVVLKKTVLYPQKSGNLAIEPLSMNIDVELPSTKRNSYGQVMFKEDNKSVSAGAKVISVKALPEEGRPLDFSGAVGSFDFKVIPSKMQLRSGESLDLNVSVAGKGNLKLFSLPKPVVPNTLEIYDPVHSEQVNTPLSGMAGKISDKYTIIPQFKGEYTIKPLQFSYFDLNLGKYKTISTPEIIIKVLDGRMAATTVASNTGVNKNKVVANEQFRYIKLETNLTPIKANEFFGSNLFYSLLLIPFGLLPIIVLAKKKKKAIDDDVVGNRIKKNNRLAKKYLSEAKKQIHNKELFYVALEKAMHNFLKAKLHIETSEMSKDNINDILLAKNVNPQSVDEFITLTENCEIARYAPSSHATIQNDYDKAVTIISELERQLLS